MMEKLDERAFALRPVRVLEAQNTFRNYEATTFPKGPYSGCGLMLRRLRITGGLSEQQTNLILDILNEDGDIIQEYHLTRQGFEYLRRTLKFKVDRSLGDEEQGNVDDESEER
jgi:hypothetical protein